MSDDQTRPTEPDAPTPPPATPPSTTPPSTTPPPVTPPYGGTTAHDASAPVYAPRPRFVDQVLGMRAVVAVALACLIIGGLNGFVLGHAMGRDDGRFGRGPAGFIPQRGAFTQGPNGFPNGSNGHPHQQFGQGQNGR